MIDVAAGRVGELQVQRLTHHLAQAVLEGRGVVGGDHPATGGAGVEGEVRQHDARPVLALEAEDAEDRVGRAVEQHDVRVLVAEVHPDRAILLPDAAVEGDAVDEPPRSRHLRGRSVLGRRLDCLADAAHEVVAELLAIGLGGRVGVRGADEHLARFEAHALRQPLAHLLHDRARSGDQVERHECGAVASALEVHRAGIERVIDDGGGAAGEAPAHLKLAEAIRVGRDVTSRGTDL